MAVDFYQLRVQGLHETQYNECVMHFRGTNLTAADYIANAADLCESWLSDIQTLWNELFPGTYQTLRLTAKKASVGGGADVSIEYQMGDQPGLAGASAASQQLCPAIILIPAMGIKTAGKIFLPCIAEGDVNANVTQAAWQANVALFMAPLLSGFAASSITWDLVVFSRKNASFGEVLTYSLSPIVGFQRRRQRAYL